MPLTFEYAKGLKMTREFIMVPIFDNNWGKMNLSDNDLRELQNYLMENPGMGDIIQGTGGLIKLRWNLPDTGKRSGVRLLYIDFVHRETTILVNCYTKSEKDSISDKEKAMYKILVKEIGRELK